MRKHIIRLIVFLVLFSVSLLNVNIMQVEAATTYKVTLDGKAISVPVVSKNNTYYFQLSNLLKVTGWTSKVTNYKATNSQLIEMKKGDNYCSFYDNYDSISVYCNLQAKFYKTWDTKLDKKMFLSKGNLYVPLKFVKDILRLDVTVQSNQITLRTLKDHTLLVYIIASDLESNIGPGNPEGAATADLKELMKVGSTSRVNVAVQTGGTKKWNNDIIKGTSVQRWYVQKGSMKKVSDLGQKNMGDSKDLQGFIEWGMANYPAESYTLVLWDHGGGPLFGYGYDELSKDKLSMKELKTSLDNAYKTTKKKLATIVFDACIMNSIEIADLVSPYAEHMVASQISLPAHGLDYSAIVPLLEQDTDPGFSQFGAKLVEQFQTYATKMGTINDMQLSCIKLDEFKKFMVKFNKFMGKINKDMDEDPLLAYDLAIARADDYDYIDESITGDGNDLTNLSGFLWRIGQENEKYKSEIDDLRNSLDACMRGNIKGQNVASLNGMSIYMPLTQFASPTYVKDYLSLYKDIGFSKEYTSLVEKYYKKIMLEECTIDITKNVTAGTFDYYYKADESMLLQVSSDSMRKIERVDSVTEIYNDDLGVSFINATFPSFFFRDESNIKYNSNIFKLNGNYVSMIYNGNFDYSAKLFTIPVLLNDAQAYLYVIEQSYRNYVVAGVQVLQENETGMASKRNIQLQSTDVIEPLFLVRGQNGIEPVRSNNKFTLDDGKIDEIDISDVNEKCELYYNINLFNQKTIETNHVIVDSRNN